MTAPTEPIVVAPATVPEREWGARLLAASAPWTTLGVSLQTCRDNCNDPAHDVFIAHIQNQPRGIILLHPKGIAGSPYIKSIAVDNYYRNKGVGRELMRFAEGYAANISRHLFLCVSSFNTAAQDFYRQLGYTQVGAFDNYIKEGASELLLYKRMV